MDAVAAHGGANEQSHRCVEVHLIKAGMDSKQVTLVRVWDVETGSRVVDLKDFQVSGWIGRLAFSPDGRRLALVRGTNKVELWDPDTGAQLLCITVDGSGIEHLAFTADGNAMDLVVETPAGFEARRLDGAPR